MVVEFGDKILEKESNVKVKNFDYVKRYGDGRINTFQGSFRYKLIKGISMDVFPKRNIFEVEPYFFEIYKEKNDSGIVVDIKKLEIRVLDNKNIVDAFKLYHRFKKSNLNYKVVKESN
jgi:hypothetical protein